MTRRLKLGQVQSATPSDGYIILWPAMLDTTATNVPDVSGNARHGVFGSGLTAAEAGANAGWLTTGNTTAQDDVLFPSLADFDYSYDAGDNLLIAFRVNMAAAVADESLFAQGWGTSNPGWDLRVKTSTNVISPRLYHAGGTKFLSDTATAIADGAEHSVMFAFWDHAVAAGTANYMIWIDGVRAYSSAVAVTSLPASMVPVDVARLGGRKTGASAFDSVAAKFRGVHVLRSANTVDWAISDLDQLATRLWRSPYVPLTNTDWPAS